MDLCCADCGHGGHSRDDALTHWCADSWRTDSWRADHGHASHSHEDALVCGPLVCRQTKCNVSNKQYGKLCSPLWMCCVRVEVACAPCTICRLHHVQYINCTQVQYVDYKCALDVLMVKDAWNIDRLVLREPLTQLV